MSIQDRQDWIRAEVDRFFRHLGKPAPAVYFDEKVVIGPGGSVSYSERNSRRAAESGPSVTVNTCLMRRATESQIRYALAAAILSGDSDRSARARKLRLKEFVACALAGAIPAASILYMGASMGIGFLVWILVTMATMPFMLHREGKRILSDFADAMDLSGEPHPLVRNPNASRLATARRLREEAVRRRVLAPPPDEE